MDLSDKRDLRWFSEIIRDLRAAAPTHEPLLVGAMIFATSRLEAPSASRERTTSFWTSVSRNATVRSFCTSLTYSCPTSANKLVPAPFPRFPTSSPHLFPGTFSSFLTNRDLDGAVQTPPTVAAQMQPAGIPLQVRHDLPMGILHPDVAIIELVVGSGERDDELRVQVRRAELGDRVHEEHAQRCGANTLICSAFFSRASARRSPCAR